VSLDTRLSDLATAVATDIKQHRVWISGSSSGDLTGLNTTNKASLVAAINEVLAGSAGGDVVQADLDALKEEILGAGVPEALDTLDELAQALGDDENFAATVTAQLAALDAELDTKQDADEIGDPNIDLVSLYIAAKS